MSFALFGGLLSGLLGAGSANKAAKAQTQAAQAQIDLQREIYNDQKQQFAPWLGAGENAIAAQQYELLGGNAPMMGGTAPTIETFTESFTPPGRRRPFDGGRERGERWGGGAAAGSAPQRYRVNGNVFNTYEDALAFADRNKTGGTAYQGFKATPAYGFRRQQGIDAIDASAASRGMLHSGRTLQDAQMFGDNLAADEYGNFLARLSGQSTAGQAAAGNTATAGGQFAANASNSLANMGNARSAGIIGSGNAIQNGIGNALAMWQYQNSNPGGMGGIGDLFGNKNWLGGF